MKVVGIDYSTTSPAICVYQHDSSVSGADFNPCHTTFYVRTPVKRCQREIVPGRAFGEAYDTDRSNEERYDDLSRWAVKHCVGANLVMIEGYAMGASGRVFHIGENTGLLKHRLWSDGIRFDSVAPTAIKKLATGKGNSDKSGMADAFGRVPGFTEWRSAFGCSPSKPSSPFSDVVDAYYICLHAWNVLTLQSRASGDSKPQ